MSGGAGREPRGERVTRGTAGAAISIAIIDSGVNPGHPHVGPIAGGIALAADGEMREDFVDRLGHGTAVTAAIQEKAPEARVFVIKVFDDALATSVPTLVRAIDWASERGIRLVNLSLGTPNAFQAERLAPAVERAVERGTLVVSAYEHDGTRWLPGSMEGVVGVVLDASLPREKVCVHEIGTDGRPSGAVNAVGRQGVRVLAASGYPRPIPGVPVERNLRGISFAVANATGALAARMRHASPALDASGAVALFHDD